MLYPAGDDAALPETLYHYTSIHGLQGIWESGELWATDARYLNDSREILEGTTAIHLELLRRYTALLEDRNARHRAAREAGNDDEAASILSEEEPVERLYKQLEPLFKSKWSAAQCFVVSLTENGDQLSQWRAYANSGYCLGLSTAVLRESIPEPAALRRVGYLDDGEDSKGLVDHALTLLLKLRRSLNERQETNPDDEWLHDLVTRETLASTAALFKPEAFYEEEEVRIVHPETPATRYTAGDMGMVPRLSIPIPAEALVSVRVGPGAHQEQRARSLLDYMFAVNFGKAETREAAVPTIISSPISLRSY